LCSAYRRMHIARESLSFDTADQLVNTLEYDITLY
jgi:hypothetical protein